MKWVVFALLMVALAGGAVGLVLGFVGLSGATRQLGSKWNPNPWSYLLDHGKHAGSTQKREGTESPNPAPTDPMPPSSDRHGGVLR